MDRTDSKPDDDSKSVIYFHRAYKTVGPSAAKYSLTKILILMGLLDVVIILFYSYIIDFMIRTSQTLLWYLNIHSTVVHWPYLFRDVDILDNNAPFPGPLFSVIVCVVSIITVFFLFYWERLWRPLAIWLGYVSLINTISAAFFILWPHLFPYLIVDFSSLYVHTELGIWIFIPIILGLALHHLPSNTGEKFFLTFFILIYSIIFGTIRYILFLYILYKGSFIFMAALYFAFGPFFDFIYIVGFYSIYVSKLAIAHKFSLVKWRWLF